MHGDEGYEFLRNAPRILTVEKMLKEEVRKLEEQLRDARKRIAELIEQLGEKDD